MSVDLIFVMAIHTEAELRFFQRVLDSWDRLLETKFSFSILISTTLEQVPRTSLPHRVLRWTDDPALGTQTNVSLEWAAVAKLIRDELDCTCWFWWEWDAVPLRRDCFSHCLDQWTSGTQAMGYWVRDNLFNMRGRINGVAFYAREYLDSVDAREIAPGKNFDHLRAWTDAEVESGALVPLNEVYCLHHHEMRMNLSAETRLLHGQPGEETLNEVLGGTLQARFVSEAKRRFAVNATVAELRTRELIEQAQTTLRRFISPA